MLFITDSIKRALVPDLTPPLHLWNAWCGDGYATLGVSKGYISVAVFRFKPVLQVSLAWPAHCQRIGRNVEALRPQDILQEGLQYIRGELTGDALHFALIVLFAQGRAFISLGFVAR